MRKVACLLFMTVVAAAAVAHEGHVHSVLGTVKEVSGDQVIVTTKEGKEVTVLLTEKTKYEKAGDAATRKDLAAGARVSVSFDKDGKSAATIKIGASKPN